MVRAFLRQGKRSAAKGMKEERHAIAMPITHMHKMHVERCCCYHGENKARKHRRHNVTAVGGKGWCSSVCVLSLSGQVVGEEKRQGKGSAVPGKRWGIFAIENRYQLERGSQQPEKQCPCS